MSQLGFVAYELRGKSLEAAVTLDLLMRRYLRDSTMDPQGRNLADLHKDYVTRSADAIAALRKTHPDLIQACGLNDPAVQVEDYDGMFYRTYQETPLTYWTSSKAALYLMYCPIDYKGRHFVPENAVRCDDKDFDGTDMGHTIYKKHFWVGEAPIADNARRGLPLPHDFDPVTDKTVRGHGIKPDHLYVAKGESLFAANRHEQQSQLFNDTFKAFTEAAQDWTRQNYPGHYMGFMLQRVGNENRLEISLRREGMGTPVALNHPDWDVQKEIMREWKNPMTGQMESVATKQFIAQPNPVSAAGQKLYDLFKQMPPHPRTEDYPELFLRTAQGETRSPTIHRYPQGVFLAYYGIGAQAPAKGPRDAEAASPATLAWIDADRRDRGLGIQPPAPPAEISRILNNKKPSGPGPRGPQP